MIEHYRRATDDHAHARFAVAESVLDGGINSRGSDGERQTDQGAPSPAIHDRLAILVGGSIVREGGARETPNQCDVPRHGAWIVGKYSAQNGGTDAGALRHGDGQLRTGATILVAHGGNAGGAPCVYGEVTPELSERGDPGEQPCGARAGVDHVSHIARVIVPVTLELLNRSPKQPFDHVVSPVSDGETGQGFGM